VSGIVRAARKSVRERFNDDDRVVVVGNTEWKPALLGLAANSILGERGGVVCLWGRDANGQLKGSCRSDGVIALPALFSAARDSFIECGGHNASGGFSVSHERVHTLHETLRAAAADMPKATREEASQSADVIVSLREISWPLLNEISRLAPFGIGNPKPVFKIARAQIRSVRSFGKENNHIEVVLGSDGTDASMRAFDFFRTREDFAHQPQVNETTSVLATLERDTFRGPARLALRLVDITPA
jgi:single-stranded-DNA-specific exonuclease